MTPSVRCGGRDEKLGTLPINSNKIVEFGVGKVTTLGKYVECSGKGNFMKLKYILRQEIQFANLQNPSKSSRARNNRRVGWAGEAATYIHCPNSNLPN